MRDEQQLVVPASHESIGQVCEFVVQVAESAGLDDQASFHVQLAVDEACTNIVEHAYGGEGEGDIHVSCCVEDRFFVVRLEDQGAPFDPDDVPPPKLTVNLDELSTGGLGIHFIRKLMDRVVFRFHPGRNELALYKRLGQGQDEPPPKS